MRLDNNLAMRHGDRKHGFLTERQFLRFAGQSREDTMAKRDATYARFEALEERLAHCYFLLHERFITNPPLAKFWAEAAMEELQHFSILRFCRERGVMAEVDVDLEAANNVEELLDTVKSIVAEPEVSVDEAFYASLLMESSELDEVYEKLSHALAKEHPLLYETIHASLRSHLDSFADGAAEFCSDRGFVEGFRNLARVGRSSS